MKDYCSFMLFLISPFVVSLENQGLPEKTRNILADITPNFEENLKRAFINEGVRQHRRSNQGVPLDDVFLTTEGTQIELRNLKLTKQPDFRITHLGSDLGNLSLDWILNLGTLKVEGEYEANNESLQKLLPVSHNGKIVVKLENVSCQGRVGLYIRGDSFCAENYDFKYTVTDVIIKVIYFEHGQEIENETSTNDIESTLANSFWTELTEKITQIFHRQLGAVIVEYSVHELLLDQDEEIKDFSKKQAIKANRLIDKILCDAKTHLVNLESRAFAVPFFSKTFKKPPPNDNPGSLQTEDGLVQDLSTLTRPKDFSIYEQKDSVTVFGSIVLKDFKYNYEKYNGKWMKSAYEGSIRSTIYRNKIFLKISVRKEKDQCGALLDQVQVRTVDDIDMDVSGLGSLSWVNTRLRSWIIGHMKNRILPILEEKISDALNHAISINNCSSLVSI